MYLSRRGMSKCIMLVDVFRIVSYLDPGVIATQQGVLIISEENNILTPFKDNETWFWLQGGDYRLMNQQVLTDHQITHTTVQQPIMTSDGQFVYSYLPTYPTAVYHPNAQQSYQNAPNQEFQGAGYHRPGIHPMQPVSQYQQVGVPRVGQDFRYMQSAAQPNFPFQSQGMQPPIRPRSRIRHDVYRPKRSWMYFIYWAMLIWICY